MDSEAKFVCGLNITIFSSSSGFWYDSRLRCDVVDLYYELYGRKKPVAVPLPELAALRPQKVERPRAEKDGPGGPSGGGGGGPGGGGVVSKVRHHADIRSDANAMSDPLTFVI